MIPRPRMRLPLWSVPAIVASLYATRSAIRGSWLPELPMDAVLLAMIVVVTIAVWRLRAIVSGPDDDPEGGEPPRNDADGSAGHMADEPPDASRG